MRSHTGIIPTPSAAFQRHFDFFVPETVARHWKRNVSQVCGCDQEPRLMKSSRHCLLAVVDNSNYSGLSMSDRLSPVVSPVVCGIGKPAEQQCEPAAYLPCGLLAGRRTMRRTIPCAGRRRSNHRQPTTQEFKLSRSAHS